jgi:Tol biopolymer transport system component
LAGDFSAAERLPAPINSGVEDADVYEAGVFVAPDESYILFDSNRAGGLGNADIYRSDRRSSGWSTPQNLGAPINSAALETSATVSPDGKTLYFASAWRLARPGLGEGLRLRELVARAQGPGSGREHIYVVPFK